MADVQAQESARRGDVCQQGRFAREFRFIPLFNLYIEYICQVVTSVKKAKFITFM